jgi:hypothetical protein
LTSSLSLLLTGRALHRAAVRRPNDPAGGSLDQSISASSTSTPGSGGSLWSEPASGATHSHLHRACNVATHVASASSRRRPPLVCSGVCPPSMNLMLSRRPPGPNPALCGDQKTSLRRGHCRASARLIRIPCGYRRVVPGVAQFDWLIRFLVDLNPRINFRNHLNFQNS